MLKMKSFISLFCIIGFLTLAVTHFTIGGKQEYRSVHEHGQIFSAATDESLFTFEAGIFAVQDFATDADKEWLQEHGFLRAPDASIDAAYPIRARLRETVRAWPAEARKGFLRALMSSDTYDTE